MLFVFDKLARLRTRARLFWRVLIDFVKIVCPRRLGPRLRASDIMRLPLRRLCADFVTFFFLNNDKVFTNMWGIRYTRMLLSYVCLECVS